MGLDDVCNSGQIFIMQPLLYSMMLSKQSSGKDMHNSKQSYNFRSLYETM